MTRDISVESGGVCVCECREHECVCVLQRLTVLRYQRGMAYENNTETPFFHA